MLSKWPEFKRLFVEEVYKDLSIKEKQELEEYLQTREARGLSDKSKLGDTRRRYLQIYYVLEGNFSKLDMKSLMGLIVLIKKSDLQITTKNDLLVDLKNILKYKFPDWSLRFSNLEDIRTIASNREERINAKTLLTKEEKEKCLSHENTIFWKAFFSIQDEAALRTKEARFVKWEDIKFNVDGDISEVTIYATKTHKARTIFVKDATFYLKKLKEEQDNTNSKGIYVFHSRNDVNKPIDKSAVNQWFKRLTLKAIGRECWPYLLRHSRASQLYELARENKISRDVAKDFMGHSKDLSYVYDHTSPAKIKEMLKNQVYHLEELPPATKHKLELEQEQLKLANQKQSEKLEKQDEKIAFLLKHYENYQNTLNDLAEGNKISIPKQTPKESQEIMKKLMEKWKK